MMCPHTDLISEKLRVTVDVGYLVGEADLDAMLAADLGAVFMPHGLGQ